MEIDFSILDTIPPLPNDFRAKVSEIDVDKEMEELQKEIDSISTDKMPFDKYDYICIFATAIVEIATDFFICYPTNPNSLASKFNSSDNPLGKWCNDHIHEGINHQNNPIDFQGRFDQNGNQIFGSGHEGPTISFGGPDHRQLTYDHDLLRFFHALKDYKTGTFNDGGYVNIDGKSVFVEVCTKLNAKGNPFSPTDNPLWALICHLFADFWSTKGLPIPGWSFLSHCSDREVRQWAADTYREGFNFRTELLKNVPVALSELIIRLYCYARFRDKDQPGHVYRFNGVEYSKEAYHYKRKQMLLFTHAIALSFSIGKAVITENPLMVNTAVMLRVFQLSINIIKDEINYNHRVLSKMTLEQYKNRLLQSKYIVVGLENIYYTANYQRLALKIQERTNLLIKKRQEDGLELMKLQMKYNSIKEKNEQMKESNNEEIDELMKKTTYVDNPDITIDDLVNSNDVDVDNITLDELIK